MINEYGDGIPVEKVAGRVLSFDADPPDPVSWRFYPRGRARTTEANVVKELFEQGMNGNIYVHFIKVPDECPAEWDDATDLYEPEDALRMLKQLCHEEMSKDE